MFNPNLSNSSHEDPNLLSNFNFSTLDPTTEYVDGINPFDNPQQPTPEGVDFFENLAASPHRLYSGSLEPRLKNQIDEDFDNRQSWYQRMTSGLEALGLTAPKNNSRVGPNSDQITINPTFLQTLLTLTAQFSDDIFKANDMVGVSIKNRTALNENPESAPQSEILERIGQMAKEDLNHKIMFEWDDVLPQIEKGMRSAFLTGSAILKVYYDEFFKRPVVRFIPPENILIPADAPSISTAERITHIFELSKSQVQAYIRSGYFTEIDINNPDDPEIEYAEGVRAKKEEIQGITKDEENDPSFWFGENEMFLSSDDLIDEYIETFPSYSEEIKAGFFPYKVTTHLQSGKIVNITRAWDPSITHRIVKINNLFHLLYMPGDSFWGEGLQSICINLHNTATTVMTELNQSLEMANTSTAVMSTDVTVKSDTKMIQPGAINPIQLSGGTIHDCFSQIPYAQPSPLFFEYLKDLEGKIANVAGISTMSSENIPGNLQASVLFSLIEKETKPMSGVMKRFIQGINQMFKIIQRIMAEDLGHEPFGDGKYGITNEQIYGADITLMSSCDPTLSNSALRILQMQTLFEFAMQNPQLHNMLEIYKRLYQVFKINDINQLLLTEEQYQQMQQQQQEAQQQQQQQQAQMAEAQQQQMAAQNELLHQEMLIKGRKVEGDLEIEQQKLANQIQLDQAKLQAELMKEQSESLRQDNIEKTQAYKSHNDYVIAQHKLMLEELKIELERVKLQLETGFKLREIDHNEQSELIEPELND